MKLLRTEAEIVSCWESEEIRVSVACITYNHGDFIEETIIGFLIQETNFPFEVVIGEDCSTDQTRAVVESYVERYPSIIKLLTNDDNVGQQQNALRVKNTARGRYIAVCEGDDHWVDPRKLQVQADFLDANPEYVLCYAQCSPVFEGENVEYEQRGTLRDVSAEELLRGGELASLTVVYRNIIEFPKEYLNVPFGDTFCWSLCGNFGKGKYLPDIRPSVYRIHSGGAYSMQSYERRIKMTILSFTLIGSYYDRTGNQELGDYFRERSIALNLKIFGWRGFASIAKSKIARMLGFKNAK